MSHTSRGRAGFTLAEVLVTIFIVGIGLISLLTLFPYGALQMQEAIKDDRAALCAQNAEAMAKVWWRQLWYDAASGERRSWASIRAFNSDPTATPPLPRRPGFYSAMTRIDDLDLDWEADVNGPIEEQGPNEAGFPVLVDPLSYHSVAPGLTLRDWTAENPTPPTDPPPLRLLPRLGMDAPAANPIIPTGAPGLLRWTTLADNFSFAESGSLSDTASRDGEAGYNWAWLIQRPAGSHQDRVRLRVLVFQGRLFGITPVEQWVPMTAGDDRTIPPRAGDTFVALTNVGLNLKPGSYILDVSRYESSAGGPVTDIAHPQAEFYRVAGVEEVGGTTVVELDRPYAGLPPPPPPPPPPAGNFALSSRVMLFGNSPFGNTLVEVFDRGILTLD